MYDPCEGMDFATCMHVLGIQTFQWRHDTFRYYSFYIMPVANPDGYIYTWTTNRFWRKNRRPNGGVDLNRNFPETWNICPPSDGCSSSNPGSDFYRGPFAGSEPETQAVLELAQRVEDTSSLVIFLDIHSYSAVVSGIWSYTTLPSPIDKQQNSAAPHIVDAMIKVTGYPYQFWTAEDWFYLADGITQETIYIRHSSWSWLYELRPMTAGQGGFVLPEEQVYDTCREAWAGLVKMCELANGTKPSAYVFPQTRQGLGTFKNREELLKKRKELNLPVAKSPKTRE